MQAGAYKAFTRRMIEMGVPRETSIYLAEKLLNKYTPNVKAEDDIESIIKNVIKKNFSSLPYWIQVQLEFMI
jgi:predicted transcriptional regulator